jgi:hypothetical protein
MKYSSPYALKRMKLQKFCQILEERIQEEIQDAYPTDWDEDYVTRRHWWFCWLTFFDGCKAPTTYALHYLGFTSGNTNRN